MTRKALGIQWKKPNRYRRIQMTQIDMFINKKILIMKNKKLKLGIVLLLGLGLNGLQAQSMYVKENNGTQSSYALNNIQKLTFSSGNLIITESDNSSGVYSLNTLQYLNFTDLPTGMQVSKDVNNKSVLTYPNPVTDALTIDLNGLKNLNSILSILNIEGKVIKTLPLNSSGIVTLDMSQFPRGIYFCQFEDETEIKTIKIIKQ